MGQAERRSVSNLLHVFHFASVLQRRIDGLTIPTVRSAEYSGRYGVAVQQLQRDIKKSVLQAQSCSCTNWNSELIGWLHTYIVILRTSVLTEYST